MKATVERVDKVQCQRVRFPELNTGDWFQWGDEGTPCIKMAEGYVDITGVAWELDKAVSDITIPIKVHIRYEVL